MFLYKFNPNLNYNSANNILNAFMKQFLVMMIHK